LTLPDLGEIPVARKIAQAEPEIDGDGDVEPEIVE
jgi:hypothetical protein